MSAPIEERLAAAGLPALARPVWAEIDLDALTGNLAAIRSAVGPGVRVEPVVKADAYGHGAVPCARALEAAGADGFSVATLDEAYELRAGGITAPLMVLYPIAVAHVARAAAAGIATSLGPGMAGERILAAAADAADGGPALDVHVEVETGLGRGGALPADAAGLVERARATPGVRLVGVWTHLAGADDAAYTRGQDSRFGAVLEGLAPAVGLGLDTGGARRHLAGSGGVLGGHASPWDAVRPGIAIYGLVPDGLAAAPGMAAAAAALRPVLSLHARPVRVVDLPPGHGVGYGPVFFTERPSRIATLALGYGDGWHRVLTGRASALVRGVRVPLVGRVSMDAVMADVTDVPGEAVTEDDEFVLLGSQDGSSITAYEIASAAGTISYEVVTGVSRRVARVYHAAGSVAGLRTLAG